MIEQQHLPLTAAWWDHRTAPLPAYEGPLLAPYAETQPGYEVVCGPFGDFPALGDDKHRVCTWFIWAKEDPADRDPRKQRINAMQRALGPLDDETRYLRLQIACLTRCYYAFPATVDEVLAGIAAGTASLELNLSCEPPWHNMRLLLRQRRGLPAQPDERQTRVRAYLTILTGWIAGVSPTWLQGYMPPLAGLVDTTYRYLGAPDADKVALVHYLCSALLVWAFPCHEEAGARAQRLSSLLQAQQAMLAGLPAAEELIRQVAANDDRGSCHHGFFRHLDRQLALIGAGRSVELPDAGTERQRIYVAVTNYVHALGCWLAGRSVPEADALWQPGAQVTAHVYALLGDATPVKRWLVACLWLFLQDHQAHHGRGALDTEPARFALADEVLA